VGYNGARTVLVIYIMGCPLLIDFNQLCKSYFPLIAISTGDFLVKISARFTKDFLHKNMQLSKKGTEK
jgi:hypothetical protein